MIAPIVYTNAELGIESRITETVDGRFHVTLRDTDADQVFPSSLITPDLAMAKAIAASWVAD